MTRTYAIGDVHGHLDRLREVHDWIAADRENADDLVVHIGDLTDRGPDSAGVIRFLIAGLAAGEPWVVLKGNHDRIMACYLETPSRRDPLRGDLDWLLPIMGGVATLESYGVDTTADGNVHSRAVAEVPAAHLAFLAGLDTVYRTDDVFFVHAGIRPGVALDQQVENDLVWIREPFLSDVRSHGPLIIHGHTPVDAPMHFGNRVDIDSGVAFGGPLSVVVVEGREVWNLTAAGRVRLLSPTGR